MPKLFLNHPILRKSILGLLALMGFLFVFLASIPIWFNVDQYRPQIAAAITPYISGHVQLGKLSLSAWGGLKVGVANLQISDIAGESVISSESLDVNIPLKSLVGATPSLTLNVRSPKIQIRKDKQGELNVLKLIKNNPYESSQPSPKSSTMKTETDEKNSELPDFLRRAEFNLNLVDADILYLDLSTQDSQRLKSINIEANRISLKQPSDFKLSAILDVNSTKGWKIQGPLLIEGTFEPKQDSLGLGQGKIKAKSQLDSLRIESFDGYKKDKGTVGLIKVDWEKDVQGHQGLFQFEIPGLDLKVKVNLEPTESIRGEIKIASNRIDLDQLLPAKLSPENRSDKENQVNKVKESSGNGASQKSFDVTLAEFKKNPWFLKSDLGITFDLKELKSKGIRISDFIADSRLKDGLLNIRSIKANLLGGTGEINALVNLKNSLVNYSIKMDFKDLRLGDAIASQNPWLQNTVTGLGAFTFSGTGAGLDPDLAKSHFVGRGNVKIVKAKFATLNLGEIVSEGLGKSFLKLAEQIPGFQGSNLSQVGKIQSEYEILGGDFNISQGVFEASNFVGKPYPNKGLDLFGNTRVAFKDCSLSADWKVQDTYNLTKARDLALETGGVRIEHILAEGNHPVVFPIKMGGTCAEPKVNYDAISADLIRVAVGNVTRGAAKKAVSEVGKRLQEELGKKAAQPIKDVLKGIFGN